MARWCTPRRFLVYSAYFVGAFSLILGVVISKHAWNIHTTIRLIEKSWDVRGHDYRNYSWVDKATHALLAGHEDVSAYNDLFWAKHAELEAENGQGLFNRSNLTACKSGYAPEWADANAGYSKWGFVLYRTNYDDDDETWAEVVQHMNFTIRTHLEIDATHDGSECDPDLVRDRAVLEIIEDRETLDNATPDTIRTLWRERVDAGLVDSITKMGGWDYGGWFRVYFSFTKGAANGMALNLCLMYDTLTRTMMQPFLNGFPATGPRDPWEPYLLAIDGTWSTDRYSYLTSWAHGYSGLYGVALSILFNDFHGKTFEREMERQAPKMFMGRHEADDTAFWFEKYFQDMPVARPGRFPFDNRWQERRYPFVREDSHWKIPVTPGSIQDESATTPGRSSDELNLKNFLEPTAPIWYHICSDSDEDQEGCFQMGNFRVRKPSQSKKPQLTQEAVPTNDLKQEVPTEQDPSEIKT
ncbi:hypothetical protein DM02DRAFT_731343 [Periconia macrospinosa]|uniref:Uncharacterized protein n=1 Tax=Periconia macrospinosa TaxID=97972 RepID=A0A2V1DDK0_9PLEO|nr:hypothetical protein DM02DRAFT_731343 [Periconia macrospinosa]